MEKTKQESKKVHEFLWSFTKLGKSVMASSYEEALKKLKSKK